MYTENKLSTNWAFTKIRSVQKINSLQTKIVHKTNSLQTRSVQKINSLQTGRLKK